LPKSNSDYWKPKLELNKTRDQKHLKELKMQGWDCLVLWECELKETKKLHRQIVRV
jgi:DNA mismatch endonuclease (patch repair protein)